MSHLLEGCCRSAGQDSARNSPALFAKQGNIPGAVAGAIPDQFAAKRPIYFEGPVSLDQFLSEKKAVHNADGFLWPSTSRFSFVSAFAFAMLSALSLSSLARACHAADENTPRAATQNVRIAHNANPIAKDTQPQGRVISFVCGRPNTLQVIAPIDLPEAKPVRFLPQGASPIAEMKYMPVSKKTAPKSGHAQTDAASTDRIYQKLLKLSLSDPSVYQTEAQSLITYFSILTGGQEEKRVEKLEELLEKTLNGK